ncbi:hypothetical protein MKW98_021409 [Papaver atlanticum]|uniref:Histone deacetylase domain-containing protein n=1 Tax=Papaver atlanticum TaxID=357466 RepID=A0AAD4XJF9_9MAGN|nr:hypothetical protein MKW98_021409 [Papaver atlanticum]
MEVYQPKAVVLQCGADSLSGDRLGCFNLSIKGHADCLRYLRSFNVPLMVLGGEGYTAHCWCYETAVALPEGNNYMEYFDPENILHFEINLDKLRTSLLERITKMEHAPSVQLQERPPTTEPPMKAWN